MEVPDGWLQVFRSKTQSREGPHQFVCANVETEFLIEVCEGPGPCSHSGKTGTSARGHVRSSTRQSFEFGGSNRDHGRVPGSRSSISPGSSGTCQSGRRPASSGRAVDTTSTIDGPCDEANQGSGRETESIRLKEAQGRLHRFLLVARAHQEILCALL